MKVTKKYTKEYIFNLLNTKHKEIKNINPSINFVIKRIILYL